MTEEENGAKYIVYHEDTVLGEFDSFAEGKKCAMDFDRKIRKEMTKK